MAELRGGSTVGGFPIETTKGVQEKFNQLRQELTTNGALSEHTVLSTGVTDLNDVVSMSGLYIKNSGTTLNLPAGLIDGSWYILDVKRGPVSIYQTLYLVNGSNSNSIYVRHKYALAAAFTTWSNSGSSDLVTTTANGLMLAADKVKLNGIATSANNYVLPTATASVLGGVKNGTNIANVAGVLSVADGSTTTKGVVQLTEGVASTSTTTAATPNSVKTVNDSLTTHIADNVKHITAAERTAWNNKAGTAAVSTTASGLMVAADKVKLNGIAASANNYVLPTATTAVLGGVIAGNNIDILAGTIAVKDASPSTKGVVQLVNSYTATDTTKAPTAKALKDLHDVASIHINTTQIHVSEAEKNKWNLAATRTSVVDTRTTNETPEWYWTNHANSVVQEFKRASTLAIPWWTDASLYLVVETTVPWNDSSGGPIVQSAVGSSGRYNRRSTTATQWSKWSKSSDLMDERLQNVNLNTMKTPGTYSIGSVTTGAPTVGDGGQWGILKVYISADVTVQLLHGLYDDYKRTLTSADNGIWREWRRMYTEADIDKKIKISSGQFTTSSLPAGSIGFVF